MRKQMALTGCCAVMLMVAVPAAATLVEVGDPFDSGSWTQGFRESGVGNFDHIQLLMVSAGDAFEKPMGIYSFSSSGWSQTYDDGLLLVADGALSSTDLTFLVKFIGLKSDPLTFNFQAWDGQTLKENADAVWSGSAWSFRAGSSPAQYVIPEPISMVMLGCMGAGMLVTRRLRRKEAV